ERIPAAAGIVNLRYKSCPEMAGQDQSQRRHSSEFKMWVEGNVPGETAISHLLLTRRDIEGS
ncbi:hypothetical protein, partial [Enterobacter kobei]|uniref:hypothetical protein n=1 Tax=Enterobacter kobei TaxID=208224 RepID=UPI00207636B0